MAVGCKQCAAVNFCLLKSVIGDFKPEDPAEAKQQEGAGTGDDKHSG
jgi:hypothetical protein